MTNNHVNKPLMGTYKIKDMIVDIYFSPKVIETYASDEEIHKLNNIKDFQKSYIHFKNLQNIVNRLFERYDITVAKGIYIGITGPSLETSAERRFLAQCGGDAVGMSTVLEVIAAKQAGFQIIGLSAITNKADGGPDQKPDTIEDVLLNATTACQKILKILPELLENW